LIPKSWLPFLAPSSHRKRLFLHHNPISVLQLLSTGNYCNYSCQTCSCISVPVVSNMKLLLLIGATSESPGLLPSLQEESLRAKLMQSCIVGGANIVHIIKNFVAVHSSLSHLSSEADNPDCEAHWLHNEYYTEY